MEQVVPTSILKLQTATSNISSPPLELALKQTTSVQLNRNETTIPSTKLQRGHVVVKMSQERNLYGHHYRAAMTVCSSLPALKAILTECLTRALDIDCTMARTILEFPFDLFRGQGLRASLLFGNCFSFRR
ncbi:hypothetical protein N7G274_000683 [Stereocaulon virgatum]|uniref:Uncharacterized protein n=1 Tax=Stereocaulon virgatum TaxID=373712 RepID=A0ABR4AS75_9LECA